MPSPVRDADPSRRPKPRKCRPGDCQRAEVERDHGSRLDHILVSPGLVRHSSGAAAPARAYDVVHVNAEFADQVSDHDPQVVRILFRR